MGGLQGLLTFFFPRTRAPAAPTSGGQPQLRRNWPWDRLHRLRLCLTTTGSAPDARSTTTNSTTIMADDTRAPAEKANPSTSAANPPPAPMTPAGGGSEAQGPLPLLRPGHELPFVAPSSYLRPKPTARADKTPSPLDKEQMQGLVSVFPRHARVAEAVRVPLSPGYFINCPPRRELRCGVPVPGLAAQNTETPPPRPSFLPSNMCC